MEADISALLQRECLLCWRLREKSTSLESALEEDCPVTHNLPVRLPTGYRQEFIFGVGLDLEFQSTELFSHAEVPWTSPVAHFATSAPLALRFAAPLGEQDQRPFQSRLISHRLP